MANPLFGHNNIKFYDNDDCDYIQISISKARCVFCSVLVTIIGIGYNNAFVLEANLNVCVRERHFDGNLIASRLIG